MCRAKLFSAGFLAAAISLASIPQVSSDPVRAESPLELIARACPTPERLALFLHQYVVFQDDQALFGETDYWQSPEEVLIRGRGDCEDFALLACDLLNRQGKQAFIFSLYGEKGYAHTVCVFLEKGLYSVLNQDRLIWCRTGSLEELAGKLCARWKWGAVAQRYGHRGRAIRLIRRETTRGG